ncbi:SusC/RagA family TonB-linked outer membrane protein [Mariniflexile sp. HMF6888]|uniref:SusC/RagA family TonB-linked outer membrane protein n=1 Tax=Mariniflexile sp. HMF6888 TaxID=3373086 RepID=UPI0037898D87
MRIFILLFCTTLFSLTPKHVLSQNDKIVIDVDTVMSVDAVFKIIKSQTDYRFIYYGDLFKDLPKVPLKKGAIRLHTLLNQSLSSGDLNVIFTKNNTILIKENLNNQIQQQTVSGTITDQAGLPIPGATVLIKGTTKGTATNLEGHYKLTVTDPANVLVISSLGFETQEITVGNQTTINVSFRESISALDEVTINAGYYKTSERERTGSIGKIEAKTIEKQPVNNPLAAMQGYIPGVNITQDSGIPGGGFNIEIRGKNFIDGSSDPLYIVDGVPYSSEALGEPTKANVEITSNNISPLNLINPADIESIEVLKDADATAIYGSRGANGVVLITTKKGKAGKTQIKVNVTTSMASVTRFVDLLNTEQYLDMRLEALANDGYTLETILEADPNFDDKNPDLYVWDQNRYTDWQKELIGGTAYRNTAHLSFLGGCEQTQFLFSGGYQNETTVFPGDSKYGKASVHSNINHQSLDKSFQINITTDYTADDKWLPQNRLGLQSFRLPPNAPALYEENGDLNWENDTWINPLGQLENKFRTQSNNLLLNSMLSYRPMTNLEVKANLGYTDYRSELYNTFTSDSRSPTSGLTSADAVVYTNNVSSKSWIVEPQVNWKTDWGKANLNLLMGVTFQQRKSSRISHYGDGFASNDQILDLSSAKTLRVSLDEDSEYNYQSVFARLNLNWDKKYIINITGRRDGSSRFGPGRQFGDFGAIGGAWLFSKETFLKHNTFLSFGKLRSSYGITGSDNIGNYGFYDSFTTSTVNYNGSGLEPSRLFNPFFGWEENKKFEVALELGFLQNRIMLTTAWYKNRSSNQLVGIPLPETTGFTILNSNFDATVENTGLEIDFRSTNVHNKHFKWTTTFNTSVLKNKLVKFDGLENSTYRNQYVVGQPLSIDKVYHHTGVDPDTGIHQFEDYNNDGLIDKQNDQQWIEHTAPKFYGGLGNSLNYKNWSLDIFFQYKKHKANFIAISGLPGTFENQHVSVLNRWQQVGDQTSIAQYTLGTTSVAGRASIPYFESNAIYGDASFIRLRNVDLSYKIPKEVVSGMDISIYLHGQNLLTFTKYIGSDPDQVNNLGGRLPLLRQFTLGLQLGF